MNDRPVPVPWTRLTTVQCSPFGSAEHYNPTAPRLRLRYKLATAVAPGNPVHAHRDLAGAAGTNRRNRPGYVPGGFAREVPAWARTARAARRSGPASNEANLQRVASSPVGGWTRLAGPLSVTLNVSRPSRRRARPPSSRPPCAPSPRRTLPIVVVHRGEPVRAAPPERSTFETGAGGRASGPARAASSADSTPSIAPLPSSDARTTTTSPSSTRWTSFTLTRLLHPRARVAACRR